MYFYRRLILDFDQNEESQNFVNLNPEHVSKLWQPDLYIEKLVDFEVLSVLEPLRGLAVFAQGPTIEHVVTARVTIGCGMNFDNFPMDTQECDFVVLHSVTENVKYISGFFCRSKAPTTSLISFNSNQLLLSTRTS